MATTQIKDGFNGGSDNQLKVNSDGSINVDSTNPSVGPTGVPAPAQATEIAGVDPSGNLVPVAVTSSGQIEVTGTLTIGQGFNALSPGYPTQVAVGISSIQLIASNANRKYFHIFNNSSQPIYIQYQVSAALNQGIRINSGTFFTLDSENLWLGAINGIGFIAGQLIDVLEGI